MGYSYGQTSSGRYARACDGCGTVGGVRKRTCPHKVLGDSIRSVNGQRHALPWCPAPALCSACLKKHGGTKKLHEGCAKGAAEAQARYDEAEARWQTGEPIRTAALRCDAPHADWTKVWFAQLGGEKLERYVTAEEYRSLGYGNTVGLSDYTTAREELPA